MRLLIPIFRLEILTRLVSHPAAPQPRLAPIRPSALWGNSWLELSCLGTYCRLFCCRMNYFMQSPIARVVVSKRRSKSSFLLLGFGSEPVLIGQESKESPTTSMETRCLCLVGNEKREHCLALLHLIQKHVRSVRWPALYLPVHPPSPPTQSRSLFVRKTHSWYR